MPFKVASLLHRPQEGCDDRPLQLRSPDIEHIEDVDRKLEDGNVVDVFADIPPGVAETGETLVQRFRTRLHVLVDLCEPFLEGQGVEENETADAQSGGAVFLLIGLGNYVGDETGDARVAGKFCGCLFHSISNDFRGGGHAVRGVDFQGKDSEIVGEVGHRADSDGAIGPHFAASAVKPPL